MKERYQGILIGILITLIVIGTLSFASQNSDYVQRFYRDIKIALNGLILEPKDANGKDVEPFVIDGTTYLPIRAVAEALDLKVNWNDQTNTVELIDEKTSVVYKNTERNNSNTNNDTSVNTVTTQYGIKDNNTTKTNTSTSSDTSVIIGGGTLTGTPTEMQKKALAEAKSALTTYNFYGYSEKNLKSHLSSKGYINSEIKYAMDNVEVDYNEQALKCANFLKGSCGKRSTLKWMMEAYGYTDDQIEYAINHLGDFWKRQAVKRANTYNPDYEYQELDSSFRVVRTYKKTFEEYMKEDEYTDEEIAFAREELKYKQ